LNDQSRSKLKGECCQDYTTIAFAGGLAGVQVRSLPRLSWRFLSPLLNFIQMNLNTLWSFFLIP